MKRDDRRNRPRTDEPRDPEDVEVLEVVGMDEDEPSAGTEEDGQEEEVAFETETAGAPPPPAPKSPEPWWTVQETEEALRERLVRLQADFENFKKRIERDRDDHHRHATAALVRRLLPSLDNFERALASGPQGSDRSFREGVALIFRQLVEELRKEGLVAVETVGEPFDPNVHEAVATDASSGLPPSTVVEELQRGYTFRDRLLRPALVRVSVDGSGAAEPADAREES